VAGFFVSTGGMVSHVAAQTAFDAGVEAVKQWMADESTTGFGLITVISETDPRESIGVVDADVIIMTEFLLSAGGFTKA